MSVLAEFAARVLPSSNVVADRRVAPSLPPEHDVASGWLVTGTIWWALLIYASVQALLAG